MNIRWLVTLLWSLVASAVVMIVLYYAGKAVHTTTFRYSLPLEPILSWLHYNFGLKRLYALSGIPVFALTLWLFIRRELRYQRQQYLNEIIRHVKIIAEGRFDHKVPVRPLADLGELSANINDLVTKLKQAMEEERRAEQTKNELITNVSHDLRTPLTSITGYLGLIDQDRYRDEVELRHYVGMAYEESQRLSRMVQDLFEYTRLRNREMKLARSRINLVEMLRQMTAHFQIRLEEAGMEPRLYFGQPHLFILGDGEKLRRVFENLMSNAIQYGKEGKLLDVVGRMEGPDVVIEIVNYGEPIPRDELPRIFDRFYRIEKSRSLHSGGSGIGLAIVKQTVELHGGAIDVSSDDERTAFTVRLRGLPVGNEASPGDGSQPVAPGNGQPGKADGALRP